MASRCPGREVPASGFPPVGIKDLARVLGISTGTVDRALHGKPDVSAATRARVLSTAEALGYRPNLAARYLQSRKQLRISVHLPRRIALFWDSLREGIREAAAPFAPALHVEFRSYPRLGDGDIPLFEEALHDGIERLDHRAWQSRLAHAAPAQCRASWHPGRLRRHRRAGGSATHVGLARSVHGGRGRRRTARAISSRAAARSRSSPDGWRRRITATSCADSSRA